MLRNFHCHCNWMIIDQTELYPSMHLLCHLTHFRFSSCCTTTCQTTATSMSFCCCWLSDRVDWRRVASLMPTRLHGQCSRTGQGVEACSRASRCILHSWCWQWAVALRVRAQYCVWFSKLITDVRAWWFDSYQRQWIFPANGRGMICRSRCVN